jgi:hypothetical protein
MTFRVTQLKPLASAMRVADLSPPFLGIFTVIPQEDGPPVRHYQVDGHLRVYQSFRWQSTDADKLVDKVWVFAAQISEAGQSIVWRMRPMVELNADGKFRFYCRLHVMPYAQLLGASEEHGVFLKDGGFEDV